MKKLPKKQTDLNLWFKELEAVAPKLKTQPGYMRYWWKSAKYFADFAERAQKILTEQFYRAGSIKVVDFDTETTGLSSARKFQEGIDGVTDIAGVIVDLDGYHGSVIDSDGTQHIGDENPEYVFNQMCNPGVPVPDGAAAVTGITTEMVQNEPLQYSVLRDFKKFSEGAVFVGHNIGDSKQNKSGYDIPVVLGPIYNRYFNQNPETMLEMAIDTKPLFAGLVAGIPHTNANFVKMFDIELVGAHRALPDVNVNALAFSKIMPLILSLDVGALRQYAAELENDNSAFLSFVQTGAKDNEDWVEFGVKLGKNHCIGRKQIATNIKYNPYEDRFIYEDIIVGDLSDEYKFYSKESVEEIVPQNFLRRAVQVLQKEQSFEKAIEPWVGVVF